MTLISVVLPVHDDAEHLPGAIQAVLGLRGVDVELVLIDDGSADGSAALVAAAGREHAQVTAIVLPVNGGVARAREAGVAAGRGEWVWFVDSDDAWEPDAAAALLAAAGGDSTDVVVAAADLLPASGSGARRIGPSAAATLTGPAALRGLLEGDLTGHLWNKLFRRSLLLACTFTPARTQSDLALVAQALAGAREVALTDALVYTYRKRPGSIITSSGRRAESLALVEDAVVAAARRAGAPGSSVEYFRTRYVVLSGVKDALTGSYTDEERAVLLAGLRARLGVRALAVLLARRDARRTALALTAKVSPALHLRLLRAADR